MTYFHLFISSGGVKPNGYQGTFTSVEAAEQALPRLNASIEVQLQGTLYRVNEDNTLKAIRAYVRYRSERWRGMILEPELKGKTYPIVPQEAKGNE